MNASHMRASFNFLGQKQDKDKNNYKFSRTCSFANGMMSQF